MNAMLFTLVLMLSMGTLPIALAAELPRSNSTTGAHLYIVSPLDGVTVSNPFTVAFGLRGMGVAPAGTDKKNTGKCRINKSWVCQ